MQKGVQRFAKRALDVVVSGILLLALLPCLALLWLLVKWKLGSPAIFRQPRPGLRGVPFTIYKFRTMTDARDAAGNLLPDDARMTKFGDLLRTLSLDELPELFNVLTGKMSLVGPRPLRMQYLGRYTAQQMRRHDVPPGITGWAQVNGRNTLTWEQRFELDVWYVDHWSFGLDIQILFKTVYQVVRRAGVSPQGHVTMPEFGIDHRKAGQL
ncbi:MAG TPA: sugar transferase [Verrucomicrobiae bacterium]|jgi:lipopolysaccharide/colanic/teichoic acid biosynthesis glycosyltransferase|nr:sugar transferase [Verrucomicrobiae bacterium]